MGGTPEVTIFIEGFKTSAPQAGLVNGTLMHTAANGTLMHTINFDDTHLGSIAHLGAPTVATVLALAEKAELRARE